MVQERSVCARQSDSWQSVHAKACSAARPRIPPLFARGRCVQAVLRKAEEEWWDTLASDRSFKPFVKADWSRWLEEDDAGYDGKPEGWDAQAGAAWEDEFDSDDEDVPLDDLDISDLPDPAAPASD